MIAKKREQSGRAREARIAVGTTSSSPLGSLWAAVSERGLVAFDIQVSREEFLQQLDRLGFTDVSEDQAQVADVLRQVSEYLAGDRQTFDLPIDWSILTPFQQQALKATFAIPYGQTSTYADIARLLGKPGAARAVGRAEATNPMPVVIPCHRVVGSDGGLHGYGAGNGLETKDWLLKLEKRT
jgi:methylated-DNA-[protein]-cysteine S-methyltransferase